MSERPSGTATSPLPQANVDELIAQYDEERRGARSPADSTSVSPSSASSSRSTYSTRSSSRSGRATSTTSCGSSPSSSHSSSSATGPASAGRRRWGAGRGRGRGGRRLDYGTVHGNRLSGPDPGRPHLGEDIESQDPASGNDPGQAPALHGQSLGHRLDPRRRHLPHLRLSGAAVLLRRLQRIPQPAGARSRPST